MIAQRRSMHHTLSRFSGSALAIASLALVARAEDPGAALRPAASGEVREITSLNVGEPSRGELTPGALRRFVLALPARSCAFTELRSDRGPTAQRVRAGHAAQLLRDATLGPGAKAEFDFCTYSAEELTFELAAPGGAATFELSVQAVLPRVAAKQAGRKPGAARAGTSAARRALRALVPNALAPALDPLRSPQLRELRDALAAGARDPAQVAHTLAEFWHGAAARGAPFLESAPELRPGSLLVTFLWRGEPNTRAVELDCAAWSFEFADRGLARLGTSDVWYKSLELPAATRLAYRLAIDPPADPSPDQRFVDRAARAVGQLDPLNPRRASDDARSELHELSRLELPDAPPELWLARAAAAPPGRLERQRLHSERLDNDHELEVYVPAAYASLRDPLPLLIVFDGESYVETIPTPQLLDALIAGSAIPPLIAVFVRNASPFSRNWELPCNPDFAEFLATELLPWLRASYRVSDRPERVALAGSSFGGLAATFAALRHPELFGLVLSQSGSYWWMFSSDHRQYDGTEKPGWLGRRFAERPRLPLRFYLSAGLFERAEDGNGVLESGRAFRTLLRAKGYDLREREFAGGHDHLAWRADLADGLIALFGRAR